MRKSARSWSTSTKAVDTLRQRYGYRSVQRAVVYTAPALGGINAYNDNNIHPVGYFHTA